MSVKDTIESKIRAGLAPEQLEIVDESHLHKGHAGAREGGESHFRLKIVSHAFEGMTRVARHQKVYELLREEMDNPIHALALQTLTPAEASAQ